MRWIGLIVVLAALASCAEPSPRNFDVFFETNKSDLTADAQGVIAQIAAAVKSDRPSKVTVEGQASGGTPRDAELAGQRADTVVKALVAAGIDAAMIDRHAVLIGPAIPSPVGRVAAHKVAVQLIP